MRFIGNVIEKLQRHPKRVVFPEGAEPRILQAARQFHALRLGAPIVLGDAWKSGASGIILDIDTTRGSEEAAQAIKSAVVARPSFSLMWPQVFATVL